MSNPYLSAQTGEEIVGGAIKREGRTATGKVVASADPLVNNGGELNASSTADAIQAINQLMQSVANGDVVKASNSQETVKARQEMFADLIASYHDTASNDFSIIGEDIANTVRDTAARAGFLRRFLSERNLQVGEIAKIRLRRHQVNGFAIGDSSLTVESRHDGRFLFPEEVTYSARPIINEGDLYREGMGLMDEKMEESLEAVMTQEDRALRALFIAAVEASGAQVAFTSLTPVVFNNLKQRVVNTGGLPVNDVWMSNDLWDDIHTEATFAGYFDPITKHELVATGRVGRLNDCAIHTDTFLESRLRALTPGELYFTARPDYLGEVLMRQEVTSTEISGAQDGFAWRGWFLREIAAIGVANGNGVSRGVKL